MKHNYSNLLNRSLLSKILLTFALVLGSSQAWADELVVTSTTSKTYTENVPINGGILNSTLIKSEYIIPSSKLTAMQGKTITNMSLTLNAATSGWGDAEFKVFLKEVTASAYPNPVELIGTDGATTVYEGTLDATKTSIDIAFTTNFDYSNDGNNLLVGIYCTKVGSAASVNFKLIRENSSDYNYYSGYTSSDTGSLSRTNWYPETTFTYQDAVITSPILSVSPSAIDFGTKRAADSQTVTVKNTGIGTMNVTITNSNTTDFTVSTTSLTGIGAGESQTFNVTFNFNGSNLGEKSANITVTPDYDASDYKTIAVSATAANPNVWQDFTDGIPSTWYNEDNAWVTNVTGLVGQASPGYMSSKVLRTPKLQANAGDEIGFDVTVKSGSASYNIQSEYSTDCLNWTTIEKYTTSGPKSFAAPATGDYWLRFTGMQAGINNFTGWSLAPASLDMVIADKDIPATGVAHGSYTATVTVIERGGTAETVTAELYFGDTKVAEKTGVAVAGNSNVTIELTNENIASFTGNAYIKVTGENISPLQTDNVAVNVTEPDVILDEDNAPSDPKPTCSNTVIQFKYTAQAGWNTIVLPFALYAKDFLTIFGEGYKVYAIDSYAAGVLTFVKKTSYLTTTPYLVYAPNAVANKDNLYLKSITLSSYGWNHANRTQTKGDAVFQGTFEGKTYDAGDPDWYGVTTEGKIKKSAGAGLKGYRAYFTGVSAEARVITIDDDGETTDLGFVKMVEPEATGVYNLQGQRVEKARKGIYIVNGKKIIIK